MSKSAGAPRLYVGRAELTLALDDSLPLREVPLKPDPLSAFARAFGQLQDKLGETAEVNVALQPVTSGQRRRRRAKVMAEERRRNGYGGRGGWADVRSVLEGDATRGQRRGPANRGMPAGSLMLLDDRAEQRQRLSKLASPEPLFGLQVMIRTTSEIKGRPEAHLHALIACFEQFAGENYFRVVGRNLGFVYLGADVPWRRAAFDRRLRLRLFSPAKQACVTATEVAGLLKPPTAHCRAANVVRSGGVIPPPPHNLPTYSGQSGLLPLGIVQGADGERVVGVPLEDTLFTAHFGRAGYGKTEEAVVQFVALVRSGRGGMYLDPHGDALERILPCLSDMADRVLEINLARGPEQVQAGWNVLSMEGLGAADVETKVSALTSAFASALSWTDQNTRALSLTTMAAQSLCELALQLPLDVAPTIFQMVTILANDDWRAAVLPFLSRTSRDYWTTRFAKLASESITPVTNLLDRLRASSTVAALFGSSRSTYDIRHAMDSGKIVLACPAGIGDKDKLIFSLFLFDLFRAAKSRQDIDPDKRRPFHTFLDELQVADSGQSSETVARMLREGRKYGLRVHAATQQPTSLTKTTLTAMLTNRSHLFSTVVGAESAALLAKEWAGQVRPETITRLEKYHFLASVTLGGEVMPPFLVRGLSVEQAWGDVWEPEAVPAMHKVIDENLRRRPVAETLANLDSLDDRIIEHLERSQRRDSDRGPEPSEPGRPEIRRDHVRHLRRH